MKGLINHKTHKSKPRLNFFANIKYNPITNRNFIELPTGYVFVGEGDEVEVDVEWLSETVVYELTCVTSEGIKNEEYENHKGSFGTPGSGSL